MGINERTAALLGGWVSGIAFGAGAGVDSFWLMGAGLAAVLAVGWLVAKLETAEWLRERGLES